ncbi:hypothetical protein BDV93DRAFT_509126 [Ceratobasidium sp. AG-I]|nr:hypothetical protein BDV93DRAFT_509126 [Ceratobasidium sp. AG-I]
MAFPDSHAVGACAFLPTMFHSRFVSSQTFPSNTPLPPRPPGTKLPPSKVQILQDQSKRSRAWREVPRDGVVLPRHAPASETFLLVDRNASSSYTPRSPESASLKPEKSEDSDNGQRRAQFSSELEGRWRWTAGICSGYMNPQAGGGGDKTHASAWSPNYPRCHWSTTLSADFCRQMAETCVAEAERTSGTRSRGTAGCWTC